MDVFLQNLQEVKKSLSIQFSVKHIFLTSIFPIFQGLNIRLAFAIAAGAFGSAWQHGYNTGVLNAPQALITAWIQNCNGTTVNDKGETVGEGCDYDVEGVTTIWAIIVAAFCVGGMIGGSVVGVVSKSLGR